VEYSVYVTVKGVNSAFQQEENVYTASMLFKFYIFIVHVFKDEHILAPMLVSIVLFFS